MPYKCHCVYVIHPYYSLVWLILTVPYYSLWLFLTAASAEGSSAFIGVEYIEKNVFLEQNIP